MKGGVGCAGFGGGTTGSGVRGRSQPRRRVFAAGAVAAKTFQKGAAATLQEGAAHSGTADDAFEFGATFHG